MLRQAGPKQESLCGSFLLGQWPTGSHVMLEDGRRIIDFAGSAGILGHRHSELVNAIKIAADKPLVGEAHAIPEREQAAEQLLDVAFKGEQWVGGVRFCTSASDAID